MPFFSFFSWYIIIYICTTLTHMLRTYRNIYFLTVFYFLINNVTKVTFSFKLIPSTIYR